MYNFAYHDLAKALCDLEIFSSMNCNENRTLYLCDQTQFDTRLTLQIQNNLNVVTVQPSGNLLPIRAIAINGQVFVPAK